MVLCSELGIPNWAIFLITVVILLYLYLDIKFRYWRRRGVPSPNLWGYLKNVYDVTRKPTHEILLEQYKKYGRIHGLYSASRPILTVADPVLLKQILVKDFHVFPNRVKAQSHDKVFNSMLTILLDENWKRIRNIVSPTFSSSRMRTMAHLVRERAENFSKHCEKAAEKREEINCRAYYNTFAVEVIASTAFGTKLNAFENPDHPFVQNAKKMFSSDQSLLAAIRMVFPQVLRFLPTANFFKVIKYFQQFAIHVIQERDKNNIRANDFLQLMLDAQRGKLEKTEEDVKEEKGSQQLQNLPSNKTMSLDEVLSQCILFFAAGGETTSTTLAFFSYFMALHPKIQERLREEVDRIWEKHEEINFDVLSEMTYLDAVLSEVQRIKPASVQLLRISSEDYKLGDTGITIDKGTSINVSVQAMHLDPEFFPEPEKFDPERFMPENKKSIQPYTYLPFGEGPRNCIGMRFAIMEIKLCILYLLRNVRLDATEKTKKPLQYYKGQTILVQPKEVMVRLVKRR